jgi:uncharacterized membrane protein
MCNSAFILGDTVQEMGVAIPLVAVTLGLLAGIVGIIAGALRRVSETKAREESRREIAAYVAEGTISPDDAVRLLAAGKKPGDAPRA